MRTFLVLAFPILATKCVAATQRDSLWAVWNDRSRPDTVRMEAVHTLAWDGYMYSQPDSAYIIASMLLELARATGDRKHESKALTLKGSVLYIKGDLAGALDLFQQSLRVDEATGDRTGVAVGLANIGSVHMTMGDRTRALQSYTRSLQLQQELGDEKKMATTLSNIGLIHMELGDNEKALSYYKRGAAIHERLGERKGLASALHNMGNAWFDQGDLEQAMEHFRKSLAIRAEVNDRSGMTKDLRGIGQCLMDIHQYDAAMEQFEESLRISRSLGDDWGIASTMRVIGQVQHLEGKHHAAATTCDQALELARRVGSLEIQRNACQCAYEAYKALGAHEKALALHEDLLLFNDSLEVSGTKALVRQMEFAEHVRLDSLAQAERERRLKEAHREEIREKNLSRNVAIASGLLLFAIAAGLLQRYRFIRRSKAAIERERDRSEKLLLNILPAKVAEELKATGSASAREFDDVSILFTDFKGFTETSATLSAQDLVIEINTCFAAFDAIIDAHRIEKIKTIGDAYMAAGGVPEPRAGVVRDTVLAALAMQDFMKQRHAERSAAGLPAFRMRVGIHTGPVVAGIVGTRKFQYDIWGDTVNTASRMESSGEVGQVNISEATYALVRNEPDLRFTARGKVQAKGKGEMEMYFVALA